MDKPAISIIMNCLNGSRDLSEALESVRRQSFQDYEIIFLDNGSTDASPEIARNFGERLRYFRNSETVPLGAARNQAIARARGEFVAFLDCDDIWLPDKLARQLELFAQKPSVGLVCTDTEVFKGNKTVSRIFETARPARGMVFEELMERQWISMSSAMVRRKALDSVIPEDGKEGSASWFDERLNVCEEADLFYRIAHDWELDYAPEALTRWRLHSQNTTFRKFHQFSEETLLILEKHLSLYPGYEIKHGKLVKLLERRASFQAALALWKDGRNREARAAIGPHVGENLKYRLFWLATYLPGSLFDMLGKAYFALPARLRG